MNDKSKTCDAKVVSDAPCFYGLDGSTGQNALQNKQFTAATEVTSLAIRQFY
jgi:signal recognition particle GTPase